MPFDVTTNITCTKMCWHRLVYVSDGNIDYIFFITLVLTFFIVAVCVVSVTIYEIRSK